MPLLVLIGTAVAVSTNAGRAGAFNPGAHGFSEILYAITSPANNNGSAPALIFPVDRRCRMFMMGRFHEYDSSMSQRVEGFQLFCNRSQRQCRKEIERADQKDNTDQQTDDINHTDRRSVVVDYSAGLASGTLHVSRVCRRSNPASWYW